MGFMYFIHLLFDVVVVVVPLLGRERAIFEYGSFARAMFEFDRGENFVAHDFIKALGCGGKLFEIIVIERSYRRIIETSR